jgi:hypothetical protein
MYRLYFYLGVFGNFGIEYPLMLYKFELAQVGLREIPVIAEFVVVDRAAIVEHQHKATKRRFP